MLKFKVGQCFQSFKQFNLLERHVQLLEVGVLCLIKRKMLLDFFILLEAMKKLSTLAKSANELCEYQKTGSLRTNVFISSCVLQCLYVNFNEMVKLDQMKSNGFV